MSWQRHEVTPSQTAAAGLLAVALVLGTALAVGPTGGCRCQEQPARGPATEAERREVAEGPAHQAAGEGVTARAEIPTPEPITIRPAVLAGSWYPASRQALRESLADFLDAVEDPQALEPMALIVPHAGHRWSGQTAAYAYRAIRGHTYRRVFILAPAHRVRMVGAAVPTVSAFETPLGIVPIDTDVTRALAEQPGIRMVDRPHAEEHAIEIHLPFLQTVLREGFRIVPIVLGEIDVPTAERFADALRPFLGTEDLVVVSSDFTHYGPRYGYVPFSDNIPTGIRALDMGAYDAIRTVSASALADFYDLTGITVCGYYPILVLLSLLPPDAQMTLLWYDTSGRQTGDYENSVSYLSIAATGPGWPPAGASLEDETTPGQRQPLTPREQEEALRLARTALESYVWMGEIVDPEDLGIGLSDGLAEPRGVFVTLRADGRLRGCIGNIWPAEPLARAIVGRTVDAASHDRRFLPVSTDELADLDVEISVLTTPTRVRSYNDIAIGRHGIVLERDNRSAVFLPQVATEQGWTLEETLSQLSEKAGLPPNAWRAGARFQVFEAQVFGEAHH